MLLSLIGPVKAVEEVAEQAVGIGGYGEREAPQRTTRPDSAPVDSPRE
jgi:hypothetical protein